MPKASKPKWRQILGGAVCLLFALAHAARAQDANKTPIPQQQKPKPARVHALPKPTAVQRAPASNAANANVGNAKSANSVRLNYAQALQRYCHERHDRNWWRQHFTVIVLVGGGYYYWDAGYWFPAWGYNPLYEYYEYDGPIYTYGNLLPDQVIVNVQRALKELGYYGGGLNGSLNPATRQAIANYQQDAGLGVTGIVDAPTVESLGLN